MERKTVIRRYLARLAGALLAVSLWPSLLLAATLNSAPPDGARLFNENCAACHGSTGEGGVGVPLSLASFQASVDDAYLRTTIRLGRPGRVMPAFRRLHDDEVNALVAYIRSWTGNKPPKLIPAGAPGDPTRGARLFAGRCAVCHGENGQGGQGTGVTMSRPRNQPILAPGLNNPGFLAAASDSVIKTTLVRGRAGTPMRSFLKQGLSERDINDIVAYVRSFQKLPPPASATVLKADDPDIIRVSPYGVEETVDKLKTAIAAANMRLIRVQYLDDGFVPAGQENRQQVIVYSCDFGFLNEALKVDPRIGMFLPCRVTVLKDHGKVLVMSVNPKRLSAIFNNSELNQLCDRMYKTYVGIIEEATF